MNSRLEWLTNFHRFQFCLGNQGCEIVVQTPRGVEEGGAWVLKGHSVLRTFKKEQKHQQSTQRPKFLESRQALRTETPSWAALRVPTNYSRKPENLVSAFYYAKTNLERLLTFIILRHRAFEEVCHSWRKYRHQVPSFLVLSNSSASAKHSGRISGCL